MKDLVVNLSGQDNLTPVLDSAKQSIQDLGDKGRVIDSVTSRFAKMENSTKPLKTQLRQLQGMLGELNYNNLQNTEVFDEIAQKAAEMKDALGDSANAVRLLSSDTASLDAGIQAFQGLTAVATTATGVMGLLGVENDKVQQAILKVQSAMAVLNGVQQISTVLQRDSILVLKLKQVIQNANTASVGANTVATVANSGAIGINTTVTKAWNVVKAISKALLGDFTGLLLVGAGALATYAICTSDNTEEEKKRNEELEKSRQAEEEKRKAMEKVINGTETYTTTLANSYSQLMVKYVSLQSAWRSLSTEQQKTEWRKNNKSELDALGFAYKTVNDVENILVKNTNAVAQAFMKRAQLAAYQANLTELYKEQIELNEKLTDELSNIHPNNDAIVQLDNDLKRVNARIEETARKMAQLGNVSNHVSSGGSGSKNTSSKSKTEDPITKARKTFDEQTRSLVRQFQQGLLEESEYEDKLNQARLALVNAYMQNGTEQQILSDEVQRLIGYITDYRDKIKASKKAEEDKKKADKELEEAEKERTRAIQELNDEIKESKREPNSIANRYGGIGDNSDNAKLNDLINRYDSLYDKIQKAREEGIVDEKSLKVATQQLDNLGARVDVLAKKVQNGLKFDGVVQGLQSVGDTASYIKGLGHAFDDCKTALDYFINGVNIVVGALQTYQAIVETVNLLTTLFGATQTASAVATTASATAQGEKAIADEAQTATATTATIAMRAEEAAALDLAAANIFLAHSEIPFAGVGLATGMVAEMMGAMTAQHTASLALQAFYEGGIVKGANHSDGILARLSANEMVLSTDQQSRLFNMLDGKGIYNKGFEGGKVQFELRGDTLRGAIKNYEKRHNLK